MSRVEKLSDSEYKIVTAIRKVMADEAMTKEANSTADMRGELEGIYDDLNHMEPYNQNEVINAVRSRIYSMLY